MMRLTEKQAMAMETGVRTTRMVRVPGSHYMFISNESEVQHEMRKFIDSLKSPVDVVWT